MKMKNLIFGGIGFVGVAVFGGIVSTFLPLKDIDSVTYSVKLVPDKDSSVLKVVAPYACNKGKHYGCMLFEQDKVGVIYFYLGGSRYKTRMCGDKSNPKQVITKIELTATGEGDNDLASKGDFNLPLDLIDLQRDAFPKVKLADGIIYSATKDTGKTRVRLINSNGNAAEDGVMPFWYRVTATDCEDSTLTWIADPRGDNEGIN